MSFDTTALLATYSGWSEKPNSRVAQSAYRGIAEEDNSHLRLGSTLSSVAAGRRFPEDAPLGFAEHSRGIVIKQLLLLHF